MLGGSPCESALGLRWCILPALRRAHSRRASRRACRYQGPSCCRARTAGWVAGSTGPAGARSMAPPHCARLRALPLLGAAAD
eukprot:3987292-Pyramimonas_sp.AAC.1